MSILNLVITGMPRAGTTMTAALVDSLENAVCFSEPQWQVDWNQEAPDRAAYAEGLIDDFRGVRRRLMLGEAMVDRRNPDGSAVTSYFRQKEDGSQETLYQMVPVCRPSLSSDFLLAMKHNAHYTCVLPELLKAPDLSVLAIIRHPIPTILSWRARTIPIQQGRLPAGERYWPELRALTESTQDVLRIQVGIYNLFYERYRLVHPNFKLMRYEDLVEHPDIICRHLQRRQAKPVPVSDQNRTRKDAIADTMRIKEYLRRYCPSVYELYPDIDHW